MKKFLKSLSLVFAVVMVGAVLCACVPSNLEKAKARMEDAGYTVVSIGKDDAEAEGLVGGILATKGALLSGVDTITAMLFDSKDSAEKFYEKYVNNQKQDDDTLIKQSGKWVFSGTEQALKDFGA